jgi:hypothetical protein
LLPDVSLKPEALRGLRMTGSEKAEAVCCGRLSGGRKRRLLGRQVHSRKPVAGKSRLSFDRSGFSSAGFAGKGPISWRFLPVCAGNACSAGRGWFGYSDFADETLRLAFEIHGFSQVLPHCWRLCLCFPFVRSEKPD